MSGGEHTWKRVLFDSNMVSRWMDGDSGAPAIAHANRDVAAASGPSKTSAPSRVSSRRRPDAFATLANRTVLTLVAPQAQDLAFMMPKYVATLLVLVGCAGAVQSKPPLAVRPAKVSPRPLERAPSAMAAVAPATPVPFDDQAILAAICGSNNIVPPPYAGCLRCPEFTTFALQGQAPDPSDQNRALFSLDQSFRGSFTRPNVEQAALSFYQGFCEPSQWTGSGSMIVMQRGASGLDIAHHDRAFRPEECLASESSNGLTQLLCRVSQRHTNGVSDSDAVIVHDWTRPADATVVELVSSVHSACDEALKRPGYANYVLRKFAWVDANNDAHPDVTISIGYALFSGNKADRLRAACSGPNPKPRVNMMPDQLAQYFADKFLKDATLQFTWSETGWEPAPQTRTLLDAFDKLR